MGAKPTKRPIHIAFIATAALLIPMIAASPKAYAGPAPAPDSSWQENSFQSAGGASIHYRFRPGTGPAVLLVHGRSIDGEGFNRWMQSFPGRAMMIIDRRGYGSSEAGELTVENLGEMNHKDIEKAVDIAGALGGSGKTAIVTISLGGMLLPKLSPDKVAWVGLINPGVFGMMKYMDSQTTLASWGVINGYNLSLFWLPPARAVWIETTGSVMTQALIDQIRESGVGAAGFGNTLSHQLDAEISNYGYNELVVQETVWFLTSPGSLSIDPHIPVFLGTSDSDEVVPQGAYAHLREQLQGSASVLRANHWPGGHLAPLMDPALVLPSLQDFDQNVNSKSSVGPLNTP